MYRTSINFHKKLMNGEVPISYIVIETHMGYRAFAEKELSSVFDVVGLIADGSVLADGSELAGSGSAGVLEKSGNVISFGSFDRELQSIKEDVLASYNSKTLQSMTIEIDNSDSRYAKLIAAEPFIGRPLKYYVGFEELSQSEHLEVFSGIITEMTVLDTMTLEANEE